MTYPPKSRLLLSAMAAIIAVFVFNACQDHRMAPNPQTLPDAPFYALTSSNQILALNVKATSHQHSYCDCQYHRLDARGTYFSH